MTEGGDLLKGNVVIRRNLQTFNDLKNLNFVVESYNDYNDSVGKFRLFFQRCF